MKPHTTRQLGAPAWTAIHRPCPSSLPPPLKWPAVLMSGSEAHGSAWDPADNSSPVEVSEVALATLDHDGEVAQALVQALRRLALHLVAEVHVEGSPVGGPLRTTSRGFTSHAGVGQPGRGTGGCQTRMHPEPCPAGWVLPQAKTHILPVSEGQLRAACKGLPQSRQNGTEYMYALHGEHLQCLTVQVIQDASLQGK